MIDTHTHLYFPEYGEEIANVMAKCEEAGVSHMVLPNVDLESLPQMKNFQSLYPKNTSMAIGLHPTEVKENWKDFMKVMEEELAHGNYVAVGEIGIDLHWDKTTLSMQKEAFKAQLKLAEKYNLTVIIHSRDATEETMEVIEKVKPEVPLVFHSFTGEIKDVERIRKSCDPFFGINGVVTYKNAPALRDALPIIGLNRIVLETDAPFLSPAPHRGKRNDSSFLGYIRDKIAEVLREDPSTVEAVTDKNARDLFVKLPNPSASTSSP